MTNRGLVYGYDRANNNNVRIEAYTDGTLGVSLNAGITIDTGALATSAKQDEQIVALSGVSTNLADSTPGISGPTLWVTSQPVASGASIGGGDYISINSTASNIYRNLSIFGKTTNPSTWKLVYTGGSENFEELDSTTAVTSDSGTSGTSYAFFQTWNNVPATQVTLLNSGVVAEEGATFYYTLTR